MLIVFSRISLLPQNPNFPIPLSLRTLMSSPAAAKVVAEYAKSNRSSCKRCDKPIASGSLRLGLSTKDPRRGFELVKWHHLDCFPPDSRPLAEEIKGFSALKGSDQEALKNLEAAPQDLKRESTEVEESTRKAKKAKVQDGDDKDGSKGSEEKGSEVLKSPGAGELEISFSVADVKNVYKDAALEPNWKSFKTIIFREAAE